VSGPTLIQFCLTGGEIMFGLNSARSLVKRWLRRLYRDTNQRHATERLAFVPNRRETRARSVAADHGRTGTQLPGDLIEQYTLQAVCEWYEAFVHETVVEDATQGESLAGTRRVIRVLPQGERRSSVPGFPGAARQTLTYLDPGIRARFFNARGDEVGSLELWPEGHAWSIETADGATFRLREVASAGDLKMRE
jgi:hypothetical protein